MPVWQSFYGDLWRHRPHPCPRKVNTSAYSKGRRREAAILIQHMVRWRLSRGDVLAPIGTAMTGFDASNAFMSVHHTTLDKLVETSFEDERDRALVMQRYRGAHISLCANADEPRVEIVPSCGFFYKGTSLALLFLMMSTVSKSPNGNTAAKRRTETRSTYTMMHHPPSLLTTSRNEL